ncbi:MAG TPA: NAD+ synthase, partial [Chloroflexi bacterium]|nr:NAD+ synthase [Chloroflexota bacterium]
MRSIRIALAQINVTVGDIEGNKNKILHYIEEARKLGVELVAFPEMAVTGYPPEDLLLKPDFIEANLRALEDIIPATRGITAVVGFVHRDEDIYNAAAVIHDGKLAAVYRKMYLPNYGVFDEDRYFQAGQEYIVFELDGTGVGVNICEDIWHPGGPAEVQALAGGAEVIVNISASPYHARKVEFRERMLATRAADSVSIVAFCNLVGGQDELVFDGGSVIFDPRGELIARGRQFEEDLVVADLDVEGVFRRRLHDPRRRKEKLLSRWEVEVIKLAPVGPKEKPPISEHKVPRLEPLAEIYKALVTGTRDYVHKNGFRKVVIGLSGGIDSSLTATIAVDALGAENVTGVYMPSRYSSEESRIDAEELARNLGIAFHIIPIDETFQAYLDMLSEVFKGLPHDVTEENIQARIRGNILMALSNKFGWLVLTTGNKSEIGVGYCTLYGDTAGGFAVIKDIPKTLVYKLARYRNSISPVIPERVFTKPPSAELRPNQKDTDSLPPYEILDPILHAYVEEDRSIEEIVAMGFDR